MQFRLKPYRLALAAVLLSACDAADAVAPQPGSPAAAPLLQRVVELGFDPESIVDGGDYFLVEGDMLISKASLAGAARPAESGGPARPDGPRFQYHTTNRLLYTDLRIDFSQVKAQNAAWTQAVRDAMAAWNAIPGARVSLAEAVDPLRAPDITVFFGSCPDTSAVACAEFPTSMGGPGTSIRIQQAGEVQKLYTIAHELGHTLGFRHTNWNNRTCINQNYQIYTCTEAQQPWGAVHVPNTPTSTFNGPSSDPASVMNAVVRSWSGFSYYDRIAARYLFPGGAGPAPSGNVNGSHPSLSWSAMGDAVQYKVYYRDYVSVYDPIYGSNQAQARDTYVGTTTGTSFTDTSRSFSQAGCSGYFYPVGYVVRAVFPEGAESASGPLACFTS